MIRLLALMMILLTVACREEAAQDIAPLPLTEEAVGHFCQMNLFEHEGPKGQVHLAGFPQMPLFFSQVRDAIAYQRLPEQSHEILAIWVNDMGADGARWSDPGTENWIDARAAYFVVGGETTGGMGAPETVPFSDPEEAARFAARAGGKVMRLDEIPDAAVLAPVATGPDEDESEFEQRLRALSDATGD